MRSGVQVAPATQCVGSSEHGVTVCDAPPPPVKPALRAATTLERPLYSEESDTPSPPACETSWLEGSAEESELVSREAGALLPLGDM